MTGYVSVGLAALSSYLVQICGWKRKGICKGLILMGRKDQDHVSSGLFGLVIFRRWGVSSRSNLKDGSLAVRSMLTLVVDETEAITPEYTSGWPKKWSMRACTVENDFQQKEKNKKKRKEQTLMCAKRLLLCRFPRQIQTDQNERQLRSIAKSSGYTNRRETTC